MYIDSSVDVSGQKFLVSCYMEIYLLRLYAENYVGVIKQKGAKSPVEMPLEVVVSKGSTQISVSHAAVACQMCLPR